jgi:integrase
VQTPKKERGSRTAMRAVEYTKLLSLASANSRDYAILQVFLQTEIRVSELCAVTRKDINFEQHLLRITSGIGKVDGRVRCPFR